jgi:hypothetical protein
MKMELMMKSSSMRKIADTSRRMRNQRETRLKELKEPHTFHQPPSTNHQDSHTTQPSPRRKSKITVMVRGEKLIVLILRETMQK